MSGPALDAPTTPTTHNPAVLDAPTGAGRSGATRMPGRETALDPVIAIAGDRPVPGLHAAIAAKIVALSTPLSPTDAREKHEALRRDPGFDERQICDLAAFTLMSTAGGLDRYTAVIAGLPRSEFGLPAFAPNEIGASHGCATPGHAAAAALVERLTEWAHHGERGGVVQVKADVPGAHTFVIERVRAGEIRLHQAYQGEYALRSRAVDPDQLLGSIGSLLGEGATQEQLRLWHPTITRHSRLTSPVGVIVFDATDPKSWWDHYAAIESRAKSWTSVWERVGETTDLAAHLADIAVYPELPR